MHLATAKILLRSPYCQSRFHNTPKLSKEGADAYEKRTWRERLHVNSDGEIVIPSFAFANCIKEAAKFLSIKIPGERNATWTKQFEAGVLVFDDVPTGILKSDAIGHEMFVPADGVRGSGKRVMKTYPMLRPGVVVYPTFGIMNEKITPEVFLYHLEQAGQLIGIGAFRVRNNGIFGRFTVEELEWRLGSETQETNKSKITIVEGIAA